MGSPLTAAEIARRLRALAQEIEAGATVLPPAPVPAVQPPSTGSRRPIAWVGYLSRLPGWTPARVKTFVDRVIWLTEDLDIGSKPGHYEPSWPMTWMRFESAGTFRADIKNPNSSGTGLIQFMDKTAREDLNTTLAHLRSLTPEDQLNYVWMYLRNRIRERGPIRRASDGYLSILMPAYMDDPDDAVIWEKGKHKAFAVNAGLDTNRDGDITKAEVASIIYKLLAEGLKPENVG